jgi:hypothetical protein
MYLELSSSGDLPACIIRPVPVPPNPIPTYPVVSTDRQCGSGKIVKHNGSNYHYHTLTLRSLSLVEEDKMQCRVRINWHQINQIVAIPNSSDPLFTIRGALASYFFQWFAQEWGPIGISGPEKRAKIEKSSFSQPNPTLHVGTGSTCTVVRAKLNFFKIVEQVPKSCVIFN